MLRELVLKKYVSGPIDSIINHSASVYIRPTFLMSFVLTITYAAWYGAYQLWDGHPYVSAIAAIIGAYICIKYLIDFLNIYLDAIAITPRGLAVFRWEGVLEYKTEFFERNTIELMSYEQNSIRDRIFAKGDIVISLNYSNNFLFEEIARPKKRVNTMLMAKHKYNQPDPQEIQDHEQQEKFDVLVETLGEVIQDYMHKKPPHKEDNRNDAEW